MSTTTISFASIWLVAAVITCVAGCGGGGGDGSGQAGSVHISMTDAPACGFDEVNVTVSKVRIHQSDSADDGSGGWTDITLNPPQKINLLTLNDPTQPNFALASLGQAPLAAGHYTQLRLVLVPNSNNPNVPLANSLVLTGQTAEIPVTTPSAIQSGIKLIHQFTVQAGERVDLLLDFDACNSIVHRSNGTYALKPVIRVIPYSLNGIEGYVHPSLFVNQVNVNNVVVAAQANGEIVRAVVPNATTGKFFLAYLPAPATYDVVFTADTHAIAVISGVPVGSSTTITPVSDAGTPINLSASLTQSISGIVALNPADDDARVEVVARQSLVNGPTVAVKSQVASVLLNTGQAGDYQYNLTLPVAAPWLGQFNANLPIAITPVGQDPAAGVYIVGGFGETAAATYANQAPAPSPLNIAAGNATQDFTLSP